MESIYILSLYQFVRFSIKKYSFLFIETSMILSLDRLGRLIDAGGIILTEFSQPANFLVHASGGDGIRPRPLFDP